jgi:hypothetical protein
MALAIFANKVFQTSSRKMYTFNEFTIGSTLQTEKQDATNSKPSTYIKGSDLDTMSLTIQLKAVLGHNIRNEYESWVKIKDDADAHSFILDGKPLGTKWIVISVQLTNTEIDGKGKIVSGNLQLQFEEYIRPGSNSVSKNTKKSTKKASGIKDNKLTKTDLELMDKLLGKRDNKNAKDAVANGKKGGG